MGGLADLADTRTRVAPAHSRGQRTCGRALAMFAEIAMPTISPRSVALRQLRNLALITQRPVTA